MDDLELPDFALLPELPPVLAKPSRPFTRAEISAKMDAAYEDYKTAGRLIAEAQAFVELATARREELHRHLWGLFHYSIHFTDYST